MGAWGTGNFHNDDALDWVVDLESDGDIDMLEEAFEAILYQRDQTAEAPDCSVALAAAEVIAAMLGSPPEVMPEEVHNWLRNHDSPPKNLVSQAQRVVTLILRDSELKDLWFESGEYKDWLEIISDLQERLG